MTTMDGYVRVSHRGDREGDSYRSPTIQREEIERWAKNNGVTLGKVVTDENVSGGKNVKDRKLGELIERAEKGVSSGVVVYKSDRFARNTIETLLAVKRLKDADARLVGVADGIDTDQPGGKLQLNIMATLAENYLDGIKAGWKASTDRAVESGIHVASKAPIGYLRMDEVNPQYRESDGKLIRDGHLVVDPETAPAVKRAFEMRADDNASWMAIVAFLEAELGRGFARSTVTGIIKNRAYLGEARGPHEAVKAGAHDAIVSPSLFARAQPDTREVFPRDGTLTRQTLLAGLVVCDACGHKMRVIGSTNKGTGERFPTYVCSGHYASGNCESPAAARASVVDQFVAEQLMEDEEGATAAAASAEERFLQTRETVKEAEAALDQWLDPAVSAALDKGRFQAGLLARQATLDEANRAMWEVENLGIPDDAEVLFAESGKPMLYELWGEDHDADRRRLRRYIKSVSLAKADPKRRRWQPIGERVKIEWVGATEPA